MRYPITSETAFHRAKLGNRTRKLGANHPETVAIRADLCVSKIIDFIERVTADSPELTPAHRQRLADVALHGGRGAVDDDAA